MTVLICTLDLTLYINSLAATHTLWHYFWGHSNTGVRHCIYREQQQIIIIIFIYKITSLASYSWWSFDIVWWSLYIQVIQLITVGGSDQLDEEKRGDYIYSIYKIHMFYINHNYYLNNHSGVVSLIHVIRKRNVISSPHV